MISIIINGKNTEVAEGTTLLQAAREIGIAIPTLCHLDSLTPDGNCRMCITEITVSGETKLAPACSYLVRDELEAVTDSEEVHQQRSENIKLLLGRWPNVPILKAFAKTYGVKPPTYAHPNRDESEHACILCGRCVRACSEITWENALEFKGQGLSRLVALVRDKENHRCIGCSTCVTVCPTGAIAISHDNNNSADPQRVAKYGLKIGQEVAALDDKQNKMRRVGTAHLVEVMNAYDLLPVNNFKFGAHPDHEKIASPVWHKLFKQNTPDACWTGCMVACTKAIEDFELKTGPYKGQKVIVDGPEYETAAGCGSSLGVFDPHIIAEINFYCDTYGLDTISFGTGTAFVMECYENGILNKEITGGLDLSFGQGMNVLALLHHMAEGSGFGIVVGQGIRKMKEKFVREYGADPGFVQDIGMECKGLEYSEYVSKESMAQQGGYAMSLKGPQHDEAWLIFMDMVNNQIPTFEDKAEALHYFPMFRTWFSLLGLCKLPWNDIEPENNASTAEPAKVPSHVEGYLNFYAGVTGKEITVDDAIVQSERVHNFQRVFNLRMGYGTREHDRGPYRAMGPVTADEYLSRQDRYDTQLKRDLHIDPKALSTEDKISTLRAYREQQYEHLLDAVYKRRGWTNNGVPTIETLQTLGIDFPWITEVVRPHL
jgi:aldehyde:ferredoxin oxidoreductase